MKNIFSTALAFSLFSCGYTPSPETADSFGSSSESGGSSTSLEEGGEVDMWNTSTSETGGETGDIEDPLFLPFPLDVFCLDESPKQCFVKYSSDVFGWVFPECEVLSFIKQFEPVDPFEVFDCAEVFPLNPILCVNPLGTPLCFTQVKVGWWATVTHSCVDGVLNFDPVWGNYSTFPECQGQQPEIYPFFMALCDKNLPLCFGEIEDGWRVEIQPGCSLPATSGSLFECH